MLVALPIIITLIVMLALLYLMLQDFTLITRKQANITCAAIAIFASVIAYESYKTGQIKSREKLALNSFLVGRGAICEDRLLTEQNYSVSLSSPYMLVPKAGLKLADMKSIYLQECKPNKIDVNIEEVFKD